MLCIGSTSHLGLNTIFQHAGLLYSFEQSSLDILSQCIQCIQFLHFTARSRFGMFCTCSEWQTTCSNNYAYVTDYINLASELRSTITKTFEASAPIFIATLTLKHLLSRPATCSTVPWTALTCVAVPLIPEILNK